MYVAIITSHLLILDEPTNHLYKEIKKALAKAIKNYSSSAILVTVNNVCIAIPSIGK